MAARAWCLRVARPETVPCEFYPCLDALRVMQRVNVAHIGNARLSIDVRPPLAQLKAFVPCATTCRARTRRRISDDAQTLGGHNLITRQHLMTCSMRHP